MKSVIRGLFFVWLVERSANRAAGIEAGLELAVFDDQNAIHDHEADTFEIQRETQK